MNTLEDQLRAALDAHAETFSASPDAWDKTVAFNHRRFRLRPAPRWLRADRLTPAAAAVAVVGIVLTAATLTGAAGKHAGSGTSTRPTAGSTAATPPAARSLSQVTRVLHVHRALTAIVSAELGGTWVYAWFSDPKDAYGCTVVLGTSTSSGGYSCSRWPLGPSGPETLAAPDGMVDIGRADRQVTSVTALLDDGRSTPGVVLSGRGFPFKVWFVSIPEGPGAMLTFRDAGGQMIALLADDLQFVPPSMPDSGGIIVDGWTANLTGGKVLWQGPDNGAVVPLPWTVKQRPLLVIFQSTTKAHYALGYAPAGVGRLALRFSGGATYAAPTVPAWPGSGVRLWVRSGLPSSVMPPQAVVISYNAAGQVIGEQTLGSLLGG